MAFVFLLGWTSVGLPAGNAEYATVITDGAMVYSKPDFDSKVITYVRQGTRVVVSKQAMGAFRKVVVKKGVTGFISEVDVGTKGGGRKKGDEKNGKGDKDKQAKKRHKQKPVASTRYVGLLLGYVNYKEEIGSAVPASNEITYGLKITGPNLLLQGPYLIDFNLAIHMGAPKHYSPGADITPTGFFILLDTPMLFTLSEKMNHMVYFGLGPHLNYSRFNVIYQKGAYNMEELRIGAVGVVGGGFRIGNAILKAEYKYYWDQVKYAAVQAGLQFEF